MNIEEHWAHTEERLLHEAGSLSGLLEQLRGRVSPVLVGERSWNRLVERAEKLPVTMAAFPFGFELPLHELRPEADLGVSVIEGSRTAAFFRQAGGTDDADPSSAGIAWMLGELEREDSPLSRIAGGKMLLEYDIDASGDVAQPDPGVFLYPEEQVLVGDGHQSGDLNIVVDAVASATGRNPEPAGRRQIERVYRATTPEMSVRSVGAFPSRESGIRLAITGLRKAHEVEAFLERAGWPGQPSAVAEVASPLEERRAFAYMGVHFDVDANGVGPALGLSFYAREEQWLKDIRHWTPLVDGIREQRLAVPEKLSELTASSSGVTSLFGKSGPFLLARGIHHIKLVLTEDRVDQVKAYVFLLMLGIRPSVG